MADASTNVFIVPSPVTAGKAVQLLTLNEFLNCKTWLFPLTVSRETLKTIAEDRIDQQWRGDRDRILKPGNSTAPRAVVVPGPSSDEHFAVALQRCGIDYAIHAGALHGDCGIRVNGCLAAPATTSELRDKSVSESS